MKALKISAYTLTNALGQGIEATQGGLRARRSGLRPNDFDERGPATWIGRVEGIESLPIGGSLAPYDCRNNRLAAMALENDGFDKHCIELRNRLGNHNIGVYMGSSTSGVEQTERAYCARSDSDASLPAWYDYAHTHDMFSLASFVRDRFGLAGPAMTISTACSSSAKVFATAWRHIQAGLCSAAIVGGVDSLCNMTLHGFNALQLVSPRPCRPADTARDGISIGEAAGFALLEPATGDPLELCLLGYGESSDAYHMSAPEPSGRGAKQAMQAALNQAGIDAADIGFVHLHGTATPANDAAEDTAVSTLFGSGKPCISTKGWTGHSLGAAGITNALIAAICIEHEMLPGTLNTETIDPEFTSNIILDSQNIPITHAMSNAFGFGGSNVSLIIGKQTC